MKKIFLFALMIALHHFVFAQQGEWTWVSGSNMANDIENFGTQGVPSTLNHPSALYEACEWTDTSGMFWLYGGWLNANLWKYNPSTNEWTWVNGPGSSVIPPSYGTQGVADPANTPGSRGYCAAAFTDKNNNLWLFGGLDNFYSAHNDLWKYDILTNEWTWMKGTNSAFDPGSYGVQGVPATTNVPASRSECAASWVDVSGNFWLFGGWTGSGTLNDLWRYNPATNEWTWMKGSSSTGASGVYGTKGVANATNCPGARACYTKWNDGNDNLYLFGGSELLNGLLYNDVWKYNISTNEWVWISGTNQSNSAANATSLCTQDVNFYPSGKWESRACWVDPCKKFWFFGGTSLNDISGVQNDLWKFDPVTLDWTWASGSLIVLQAGSFGTQGVSSATNHPPSTMGSNGWTDKQGNLWLFGGATFPDGWNTMWRFVPDTSCSGSGCGLSNNQQVNFTASDTDICEKFCINFFDSSSNNPASWQWFFPGGDPSSSTDQNPANICYQTPGVFDVTLIATDAGGISDTFQLNNYITVYSNPFAPTISKTGNILTSSPANSYQWQLNSLDIPGATNQSYTILQSGLYTVVIGDENGCNAQASIDALVGISEIEENSLVNIFPNPSSGNFIVEWLNVQIVGEASIDVVNTLGQKVFSSQQSPALWTSVDRKKEIDLRNLASGVYFIEIKSQNFFLKKKIIITKYP
ncbi:MAG TPA: kelch repeat-containing protein [Chitinophagales bacterium]|nr:kelch repeat-containing protein [Chitinophagales bacterium]